MPVLLVTCPHGVPMLTPLRPESRCRTAHRNANQRRRPWVGTCARQSHYESLGVAEDASAEEVKRAFRRAARTLHPDVNPDPEATQRFMAALAAYQALANATSRSAYDMDMGLSNGRAKDPRFARFERWRREVVPLLEIYLDEWSSEVNQIIEGWLASLTAQDDTFQASLSAARVALHQCREGARSAGSPGVNPYQELQQCMHSVMEAQQQMEAGVQGGPQRMAEYVEKRFEQVLFLFPAYPELVWEREWYDTSDGWQDRMEAAIQPFKSKLASHVMEARQLAQATTTLLLNSRQQRVQS